MSHIHSHRIYALFVTMLAKSPWFAAIIRTSEEAISLIFRSLIVWPVLKYPWEAVYTPGILS